MLIDYVLILIASHRGEELCIHFVFILFTKIIFGWLPNNISPTTGKAIAWNDYNNYESNKISGFKYLRCIQLIV